MSTEITKAEDTCLTHHHDVGIPLPPPPPPAHPHPPSDSPQHLENPVLTSPDHSRSSPPSQDGKSEQALESHGTAATNNTNPHDGANDKFPEGGARAWSVTAGSFCALFAVFGVINSTGVFQQYFSSHQLSGYSAEQIGWIFSLSLFLTFFCGNPIGPFFDAKGPRGLVLAGSGLSIVSMMLLGECTSMW